MATARPGEFALIERYFRPLATDRGAYALTDDAALYRQRPGDDLVLTADMVAAGVHFFADDPPDSIARKALRVNLSDLAAKGAEPFGYLLSLALPADWTEAWLKGFAAGLAADQERYGVTLLGGDTTRAAGGLTIAQKNHEIIMVAGKGIGAIGRNLEFLPSGLPDLEPLTIAGDGEQAVCSELVPADV